MMSNIVSVANGHRAVEKAIAKARFKAKRYRYQYFLQQLPVWLLDALAHVLQGDQRAAQVLVNITVQVGFLLHDKQNPAYGDSEDEAITRVSQLILGDCLLELMRRNGYLKTFVPAPDPFGKLYLDEQRKIVESSMTQQLPGDDRETFEMMLAFAENQGKDATNPSSNA